MTKQKVMLLCGLLVFALCGLFPPWLYTFYVTGTRESAGMRSEKSAGHHLIFTPPAPEGGGRVFGIRLDIQGLLVQWLCVGALTGAAWLLMGIRAGNAQTGPNPH